jgi:plasmid stability protein
MPGLLIKDFPPDLHTRLKEEAARHHRSMTRQALVLLEQALSAPPLNTAELLPPDPLKPAISLASDDVVAVIRENRDADQLNLPK